MKFTVDRVKIYDAVSNLSRAVAVKTTYPVLEGIYMDAGSDGLKMMAYNLETGMTKNIDITCKEPGKIVFKAKLLADILKSLSGDTVSFEVNDRMVCKINCGSSNFDIMGMPAEDFPELPQDNENENIDIKSDILKNMVRQTIFSSASPAEAQKPIFTGLLFEIKPDYLKVIGVDGFRLAVRKENIEMKKEMTFIVPAKTIGETVKIISENDEYVSFSVGHRYVSMKVDGYTIISRKLDGEFIDYNKIMPVSFSTKVKVNTKEIASVIERISLIINEQLKTPMRCKIDTDSITFSCATALGKAVDTYYAETGNEKFEIGINNRYLIEALRACEVDTAMLNFNGPFASVLLLPEEGDSFIYMIMPMRLKAE